MSRSTPVPLLQQDSPSSPGPGRRPGPESPDGQITEKLAYVKG